MTPEIERLVESGWQAETEGHLREALAHFEMAVKLAGDEALPRLRLGTLSHRVRDYSKALNIAARISPRQPEGNAGSSGCEHFLQQGPSEAD